jgi:AraC family transcriptional regulator of adaptative response/methylated-DNA-[protein]-cysteine methyltransferase
MQIHSVTSNNKIKPKTPVQIHYAMGNCHFGDFFIAATETGICQLDFLDAIDITDSLNQLSRTWPSAEIDNRPPLSMPVVEAFLQGQPVNTERLSLHVTGSEFQIKVWKALLNIPMGHTATYTDIANTIGHSKAVRAVGTAIGSNPVAFLVPCHRVIRKSGELGGYRWGVSRKQAIIGWEKRR